MGRAKTPALARIKDAILELPNDEQDELAAWLEMYCEVRDQEAERRRKAEEPKKETAPLKITTAEAK